MIDAKARVVDFYNSGSDYFGTHQTEVALWMLSIAIAIGITAGLMQLFRLRDQQYFSQWVPHLKEKSIMKERAKFVRSLAFQDISRAIEKRVFDQTFTRFEASAIYADLKKIPRFRRFIPSGTFVKHSLAKRLAAKKLHPGKKRVERIMQSSSNVIKGAFGANGRRRKTG